MTTMFYKMKYSLFVFVLFFACEKDEIIPEPKPKPDSNDNPIKPVDPKPFDIKDPHYAQQWHLKSSRSFPLKDGGTATMDINVEPVWRKGYYGEGIKIGIFDGPIEYTHPDLKDNLPPSNVMNSHPSDPLCNGAAGGDRHGTNTAGLIGARDNEIGVVGVAPRATLYSYVMSRSVLSGVSYVESYTHQEMVKGFNRGEVNTIAVYNGSIGPGISEAIYYKISSDRAANLLKFDAVTKNGFGGLGASLVFSLGNDGPTLGCAANNIFLNHYAVIGVNSMFRGGNVIVTKGFKRVTTPGEVGPNTWLTAPAGGSFSNRLFTTDLTGICGAVDGDYGAVFSATSSAAPLVSGVVALLREAFPKLTWRDVKLILAESAKKFKVNTANELPWQATGNMYHDAGKTQYYHRARGFGHVDAGAAFEMAKNWTLLPPMKTLTFQQDTPWAVQDRDVLHSSTLNVSGGDLKFVESVQVDMDLKALTNETGLSEWQLVLVAPDGTRAGIYDELDEVYERMLLKTSNQKVHFIVNHFLGKSDINGDWKLQLRVKDSRLNQGAIREVTSWKLIFRGH